MTNAFWDRIRRNILIPGDDVLSLKDKCGRNFLFWMLRFLAKTLNDVVWGIHPMQIKLQSS